MIEAEIIEQIAEEPLGRSVTWVCDLIDSLGRGDPFVPLYGMWRDGYVSFADANGNQLPRWRCEQIIRDRLRDGQARVLATGKGIEVLATGKGIEWVYGPSA